MTSAGLRAGLLQVTVLCHLAVTALVQMGQEPMNITVCEGDSVTFNCSTASTAEQITPWIINGIAFLFQKPPERHSISQRMLTVTSVNSSDDGATYQCSNSGIATLNVKDEVTTTTTTTTLVTTPTTSATSITHTGTGDTGVTTVVIVSPMTPPPNNHRLMIILVVMSALLLFLLLLLPLAILCYCHRRHRKQSVSQAEDSATAVGDTATVLQAEAQYSTLKHNCSTCSVQHNGSVSQAEQSTTAVRDMATEIPAEAQYSTLKHNIKVSCDWRDTGDLYDVIACKNVGGTRRDAPEPMYSMLDHTKTPASSWSELQLRSKVRYGETEYDVIKSENAQKIEPLYSVLDENLAADLRAKTSSLPVTK